MFLHSQIWHKLLWNIHETHHKENKNRFEKNDFFAVAHGIAATIIIIYGLNYNHNIMAFGIGITLYGLMYFIVHDGFIHNRLPLGFLKQFKILRKIKKAHQVHHSTNNYPYGLFLGEYEIRCRIKNK